MSAIYTLVVEQDNVIVYDGAVKGSRLKWWADGLHIYLKGAVSSKRRDAVSYHAFSLCLAHHIPLISLKSEGWIR